MLTYNLFAWLNSVIYSLVGTFFKVVMYLADVRVFSDTDISAFRDRIYMLLAIIMFFKIAISTIQYIVNPDELSNSDKGVGSILKNAAIAIVLLVVVPEVFKFARAAQSDISGYIPSIIMGEKSNVVPNCSQPGQYGKIACQAEQMSMTVLNVFVTDTDGKKSAQFRSLDEFKSGITKNCKSGSVVPFNLVPYFVATDCDWNFHILLATGVGILMVVLVISMCVEVAIRVFKFTILELMAPIPIVTYIDKSKGGAFEAWLKECKDVYLDLFIRLIIIYFIIYAIDILASKFWSGFGDIFSGELANENIFTKGLVLAFLIIGLLLFAKEAPKFICDLLGLKGTDKISGMFKRAAGILGAGFGGARTAKSNYMTQKQRLIGKGMDKKKATIEALKSAAAGLTSATGRGLLAAGQGKNFKEARSQAFKDAVAARNRRNDRIDNLYNKYTVDENGKRTKVPRYIKNEVTGKWEKNQDYYGYAEYRRDVKREKLSIPTSTAFVKVKYDTVDKLAQSAGNEKSFGVTKMNETPNTIKVTKNVDGKDYEFTIATARAYANIQVGQKATRWDGMEVTWSAADAAQAAALKEEVEKRTSYLKVAQLVASGDPTARMNRDKTILELTTNKTAIDKESLGTVYASIASQLDPNYSKDPNHPSSAVTSVLGNLSDFSVDKLLGILKDAPNDKEDWTAIGKYADVLTGVKDGFERDRTNKYTQAQAADARAKKTQEAISNEAKSGGGGK